MSDLKTLLQQAAKPVLFLLTFICICAFLAHYLTGDETLLEYARNNPELAYGTPGAVEDMQITDSSSDEESRLPQKDSTGPEDSALPEMTQASPTEIGRASCRERV